MVDYIIKTLGVSPFLAEKEEQKTPFHVAIEHNQTKVVTLLLSRQFSILSDPKLLLRQMQATDKYGNNPMHKACRFRNPDMIRLLLDKKVGKLTQRNIIGKLPLEMPHNDILNDIVINDVFREYLENNRDGKGDFSQIRLQKEPDYMFVVNLEREQVLIDQLDAINQNYDDKKRNMDDSFGLLHGDRKFLDWKVYRHSKDPEHTRLILIHFSDRILNEKAESIKMMVHLQNKF